MIRLSNIIEWLIQITELPLSCHINFAASRKRKTKCELLNSIIWKKRIIILLNIVHASDLWVWNNAFLYWNESLTLLWKVPTLVFSSSSVQKVNNSWWLFCGDWLILLLLSWIGQISYSENLENFLKWDNKS